MMEGRGWYKECERKRGRGRCVSNLRKGLDLPTTFSISHKLFRTGEIEAAAKSNKSDNLRLYEDLGWRGFHQMRPRDWPETFSLMVSFFPSGYIGRLDVAMWLYIVVS